MSNAPARSRGDQIRLVGGLLLGGGLLGWFLYTLEWSELVRVLGEVSWAWVGVATVLMLVDYWLQGWRWGFLLKHVDDGISLRTLWSATAVMWAFNTVLPLRAGNFIRPAIVARERNLPYTTLLLSTVAEYVCDAFAVVVMILLMLQILPPGLMSVETQADLKLYGGLAGVGSLVLLLVIVLLSSRQARDVAAAMLRPVPSDRLRARLMGAFDQLVAGMAAVGDPLRLAQAMGVTIAFWACYLFAVLATFRAFGLDLPVAAGLFVEAALTLSMMIPQAPGFLGMFQVVTEEALGLWGAPTALSQGIALVFWAVCFIPITVWGLWEGARAGVGLRDRGVGVYEDLADEAEHLKH